MRGGLRWCPLLNAHAVATSPSGRGSVRSGAGQGWMAAVGSAGTTIHETRGRREEFGWRRARRPVCIGGARPFPPTANARGGRGHARSRARLRPIRTGRDADLPELTRVATAAAGRLCTAAVPC